jgi:uncharacterized protein YydD (DUF2326 family)
VVETASRLRLGATPSDVEAATRFALRSVARRYQYLSEEISKLDERTRSYVAKRTAEGETKKEIIRCLKRYIAREVYRILATLSLNKPLLSAP